MLSNTAPRPSQQLVFSDGLAEVWKDNVTGAQSMYSLIHGKPGDIYYKFDASAILQTPSYLTVQIGIDEHICLNPVHLQYINHSCSPNVFFDTTAGEVIFLKEVKVGEELGYFYPATEW